MPDTPRPTNKENMPPTRRACSRCGLLGHLATTCKGGERAYLKVGLEVEGYWKASNWTEVKRTADNWHMSGTEDGSLNSYETMVDYEWRTRPGSLGEAINQLVAVYPDGTDDAVGMHAHVSFNPSDVMLLASEEFFAYFLAQWEAWGTEMAIASGSQFWKRLRGENTYCKRTAMDVFAARARPTPPRREQYGGIRAGVCETPGGCEDCLRQDAVDEGYYQQDLIAHVGNLAAWETRQRETTYVTHARDRYRQINFCSYERHGTVECRLLPMFRDARLGVLAVEKLISIYETFLASAEETVLAKSSRKLALKIAPPTARETVRSIVVPDATPHVNERLVSAELYEIPTPREGFAVMPARSVTTYLESQGVL